MWSSSWKQEKYLKETRRRGTAIAIKQEKCLHLMSRTAAHPSNHHHLPKTHILDKKGFSNCSHMPWATVPSHPKKRSRECDKQCKSWQPWQTHRTAQEGRGVESPGLPQHHRPLRALAPFSTSFFQHIIAGETASCPDGSSIT